MVLPKYGGMVLASFARFLPKTELLSTAGADYPQITPSYPQLGLLREDLSSLNMEARSPQMFPSR